MVKVLSSCHVVSLLLGEALQFGSVITPFSRELMLYSVALATVRSRVAKVKGH